MREIKFKAVYENKIYGVAEINFGGGYSVDKGRTITLIGETMICSVKLSDVELLQYTGLKDRNGVEIYQGDILKHLDGTYKIVQINKQTMNWNIRSVNEPGILLNDIVAGNVYKNANLLR